MINNRFQTLKEYINPGLWGSITAIQCIRKDERPCNLNEYAYDLKMPSCTVAFFIDAYVCKTRLFMFAVRIYARYLRPWVGNLGEKNVRISLLDLCSQCSTFNPLALHLQLSEQLINLLLCFCFSCITLLTLWRSDAFNNSML